MNGQRRDLTADQRFLIWDECDAKSVKWQAELKRIADEANEKRSKAAKERGRNPDGTLASGATTCGTTGPYRTATIKAAASGTNRGTVERMTTLKKNRPDLAESVKAGVMPGAAAICEMKRAEIVEHLNDIGVREVKAAEGIYDVIVIDPPWNMNKIDRHVFYTRSSSTIPP